MKSYSYTIQYSGSLTVTARNEDEAHEKALEQVPNDADLETTSCDECNPDD